MTAIRIKPDGYLFPTFPYQVYTDDVDAYHRHQRTGEPYDEVVFLTTKELEEVVLELKDSQATYRYQGVLSRVDEIQKLITRLEEGRGE